MGAQRRDQPAGAGPPRARYSRDIDLLHLPANVDEAAAELRELARRDLADHLRFQISEPQLVSTEAAFRITVTAYVGTAQWDTFPVDVSCERHFIGELERCGHTPVLPAEQLALPLPEFVLYPAVDQIADKVAAMYERHGDRLQTASNRWRDLADIVLLTEVASVDAASLAAALTVRVKQARRPVHLPDRMLVPGPEWEVGYPRFAAKETLLSESHHDLQQALRYAGECLNPVLDRSITTGRWNPRDRRWA